MQPPETRASEQQTDYWLSRLRAGAPAEKAEARWQLAADFEARGMPAQAVELLVANARDGFRSPELFETMSRLYRQLGNEYLATAAAVEAARLRERAAGAPRPGPAPAPPDGAAPPPPHNGTAQPDTRAGRAYGAASPPRPPQAGPQHAPSPAGAAPGLTRWLPALRAVGWFVAAAMLAGAVGVGSMQPVAGVAYALAAGALALMLAGPTGLRRWLRVPSGPLGDGGLLFASVLLFLVGGALLPRPAATEPSAPDPAAPPVSTPGTLNRGTPTPRPSPGGGAGAASPSDMTGQRFIVVGDEAGASLRVSPNANRTGVLVGDGDVVVAMAGDRQVNGQAWRPVSVPTGERGWIEADRLRPAPTAAIPTFSNGFPPSGRACAGAASVKGNINAAGELVYHRVGQEWYYRTFPEVCFRSEADAEAAGFRPSPR